MSVRWRCGVCEGFNDTGRTCTTCGAVLPVRALAGASARAELERRQPRRWVERQLARRLRQAVDAVDRAIADRLSDRGLAG